MSDSGRQRVVTVLMRPTGPKELELVAASGWRRWPARLPDQPIFYPVLNEDYTVKTARDWNVAASGVGYATRFAVDSAFVARYPVRQVGGWPDDPGVVGASDGAGGVQNAHTIARIEVVHEFR